MRRHFLSASLTALLAAAVGCAADEATETATPDTFVETDTDGSDSADSGADTYVDPNPDLCTETVGSICTWAGNGEAGFNGDGLPLLQTMMYWPIDLTFTSKGRVFVLDWNNHRVRELQEDKTLLTVIGTDFVGDGPEDGAGDKVEPGVAGDTVTLNHPTQFVELPDGKLLLSAWHNHKMRRYDPETGLVYITVGGPPGYYGDGGPAIKARMNQPISIAVREDGGFYILDQRNQDIRLVDKDGVISSVAGKRDVPPGAPLPKGGFNGDNTPMETTFNQPSGSNPPPGGSIALDDDGVLYIADQLNHRIRKIDFTANTVVTIAGKGTAGFSGDGGPAKDAEINAPRKIAIGPDGRLYVADQNSHAIRAIDLAKGTIETVAGTGEKGFSGDGGAATDAQLNRPNGFAFNEHYLYIADTDNHRVRRVTLAK